MTKGCKGYCMVETTEQEYLAVQAKSSRGEKLTEEEQKILDAGKTCNKVGCLNKERAKKLIKKASEDLLKQVERYLY